MINYSAQDTLQLNHTSHARHLDGLPNIFICTYRNWHVVCSIISTDILLMEKQKWYESHSAAPSILMKAPLLQIEYSSSSEIGNRYDEWLDWNNRSSK